ncbi:hypothetical protein NA56DRAFT_750567 [Hyaloscypha hepaticicola]|uniref:Mid2 domain-containing protein n=1 Tax=Hyaloscypha hepaticicola TaxID=2082293 RepID=A0A2J6PZL0_9HELO|nr:hypothetical protein NA56DRAFT_750567 [Hyaloscypha hepaticicola]
MGVVRLFLSVSCNTTTRFYIDITGNPVYKFAITGTSVTTAIVGTSTTTITTVATISSSSQPLASTTEVIPTSSSSSSSNSRPSTGSAALSPGATAGLGVGIALTILLLAGLISLYLWQRYRRRASEAASNSAQPINYARTVSGSKRRGTPELDSREIRELEGVGERRA